MSRGAAERGKTGEWARRSEYMGFPRSSPTWAAGDFPVAPSGADSWHSARLAEPAREQGPDTARGGRRAQPGRGGEDTACSTEGCSPRIPEGRVPSATQGPGWQLALPPHAGYLRSGQRTCAGRREGGKAASLKHWHFSEK